METKLMTYTKPGIRVQLIKLNNRDNDPNIVEELARLQTTYQIRDNRKRVYNTTDEHQAIRTFYNYIARHILQTKIL